VGKVNRVPLAALYTANAVSVVGNFMTLVAVPWFVLETAGSATKTGITAVAVTLVAVAVMALSTAAVSPALPFRLTIQHERTPEALRSRVFGTSNARLFSAAPIGIALFSALAQGYGVIFTITRSWLVWVGIAITVAVSPAFRLMDGTPARAARVVPMLPAWLENEESLAEAAA
jgi:hypothetical protein